MIGLVALLAASLAARASDLVVLGETVLPVSGPPISRGAVLIRDGKIAAVGPEDTIAVPEGAAVVRGAVVTPGFIDGLGSAGLTGPLNKPSDQDHREPDEVNASALRAIDAYSPWDPLVAWLRTHAVTTIHTGPSPGAPVGPRTLVASTAPREDFAVVPDGMLVFTLGEPAKDWPGSRTRMGSAAEIRAALSAAAEYQARRRLPLADRPPPDPTAEALAEALDGKRRVVFRARRAADLLTALRIQKEFGLNAILADATEAYLVRDAIREAGLPVLVGPPMARAWSDPGEGHHGTFENAALLDDAGVRVGLMSGFEGYVPKVRVVLFEAAIAAANGLGPERALRAATLSTAEILGIAARKGSLDPGKDADLAVFDGDPFEYASHVCAVIIAGEQVGDGCR